MFGFVLETWFHVLDLSLIDFINNSFFINTNVSHDICSMYDVSLQVCGSKSYAAASIL